MKRLRDKERKEKKKKSAIEGGDRMRRNDRTKKRCEKMKSKSISNALIKRIARCIRLNLGVSFSASIDEIKLAYKTKISMYHPYKVSRLRPEFNEIAQRKTKEINAAYEQAVRFNG
jgi:DnaJ-domain-containing protein 1